MGETPTSVIALAISFGVAFLGVLQYTVWLVKENDKERKQLSKEANDLRVLAVDTQREHNELKLKYHDLDLRYKRLATMAKRIKDENDVLRRLGIDDSKVLTDSEITQVELRVGIDEQVETDIQNADI